MALQRLDLPTPISYKGLEDYEGEGLNLEIVRRLEVNTRSMVDALISQVPADPANVPAEGATSIPSGVTSTDTDGLSMQISLLT